MNISPEPGSARSPMARAVAFERGIYPALFNWIRHRTDSPAGASSHPYVGIVESTIWVWIGASALEMAVAHLVIPWDVVRWIVLALSVWGLVWMFGMLASLKVHPHLVTPEAVHVRNGHTIDVVIPHSQIAGISTSVRSTETSRTIQTDGSALQVAMSGQVNVHLRLVGPVPVQVPCGRYVVDGVSLWADDARALAAAVRSASLSEGGR